MEETCEAKILDMKLSLPRIGLCIEETTILIVCVVTTIIVQCLRHYLNDLTSVKKMEILTLEIEERTCKQISEIMIIQFVKTVLWILSILLIVNANVYVLLAHMFSDVVFSGIFIWRVEKVKETAVKTKIKLTKLLF